MSSAIELLDVEGHALLAVDARIATSDIPARVFPLMDRVWAFIHARGIEARGHNVWLYGPMSGGEVEVTVGVQVFADVAADGDVRIARTPAGTAAHAAHHGPYELLPGAHQRVLAWCRRHGHALAGPSWEIYGDWEEDPAKLRTDIYHLIR